jgi:alanyl-tRNA synthetase
VLGSHVTQKGSLVHPDYLRFDFSHFSKMTPNEIREVEMLVNEKIAENIPVIIKEMPKEEALRLGAMALFGEKYGDVVRVVIMDKEYSVELCGGTHVGSTGEIGTFKITSESAVAAGVRRIEALAGAKAIEFYKQKEEMLDQISALLKHPQDILKSISRLIEENQILSKQVDDFQQEKLTNIRLSLKNELTSGNGFKYLVKHINGLNADQAKQLSFELKQEVNNLILVLGGIANEKPFLSVLITDDLVKEKGLNAGKTIRELAAHIKGGGGGQPFYATAGGADAEGLLKALQAAENWIKQL